MVAVVLVILAVFPRPYVATTLLAPDDSAAGLSGLFGGGGGGNLLASLLGGRGTIEADLLIGRSQSVMAGVAQRLHDQGYYRHNSLPQLEARLKHKVEVEAVRGSVLQIQTMDHNPRLAQTVVEDFVAVLRQRLTTLSVEQAGDKRLIAKSRLDDATSQLDRSQRALNAFRSSHHFTGADIQLATALGEDAGLQAQVEAAQSALLTLEKFAGPDNVQVQATQAHIAALKTQLADLQNRRAAAGDSLSQLNPELFQYQNLTRDERYATEQYEIYRRYLNGLTAQVVAAPLNLDVLDPPFIDPGRHFNPAPLGALALVLLLGIISEVYLGGALPRTRAV